MSIDTALTHLKRVDPIIGELIDTIPKRPTFTPHTNYYQSLVRGIVSQQLSVKAARSIQTRFNALFGDPDTVPRPDQIVTMDIESLRGAGLSYAKARYVTDLAQRVLDGSVTFDHLTQRSNDEIIAELTQVKGIGEWTVHMFLMSCMGRLDVLPAGDLGIQNGIQALYPIDHRPTPSEVTDIARRHDWHPYESVASWYIWSSLDNVPSPE